MKVLLDHKEPINYNVTTFWFKPPRKVSYTAGQFTELYLPQKNPDERGEKRWFTLSSSPNENLISITTKFAGKSSSTFKKTLWALKPGAEMSATEPMGDFVLPKDKSIPLVFVAGGMGLTPYHSIVKWLGETKEHRQIQFIYAVNKPSDAIFIDLFESYRIKPILVTAEPSRDWKGESGHLKAQRILDLAEGYKDKRIYVSGPEPMVEELMKGLEKLEVPKNDLVGDYFPGYPPV